LSWSALTNRRYSIYIDAEKNTDAEEDTDAHKIHTM
jgi:hypothetical protein